MYNSTGMAALIATLGTFMATFGIIIIGILVFSIIARWKLYVKAGKPGWASLVPIYSTIILFEIIGYKWYYIFFLALGAVPIVGQIALILFTISYNIKLAKSFEQGTGFGIGLWLVSIVFTAIIAFDKSIEYKGPAVDGDIDFSDLF